MSLLRPIPNACRAIFVASLAAAVLAPTANAAVPLGEQVNRGTGVAGVGAFTGTASFGRGVTDDGRLALFDHRVLGAAGKSQSEAERKTSGVYVRDVASNTTTQLVSGNARTTGLTDALDRISILTSDKLTAADTDTTQDLYLVDVATKVATLVATPQPVLDGALTRDGKTIVWADATGVYRRALTSTSAELVTNGALAGDSATLGGLLNRKLISRDGGVVAIQTGGAAGQLAIARAGKAAIAVGSASGGSLRLAADGRRAFAYTDLSLRGIDVVAGTVTAGDVSPSVKGSSVSLDQVNDDGTAGVLVVQGAHWKLDLVAGKRTVLLEDRNHQTASSWVTGRAYSQNLRYALANVDYPAGGATAGQTLLALPLGGATLPGGTDAPSPFAYLVFDPGCVARYAWLQPRKPGVYMQDQSGLPTPVSATVNFFNTSTGKHLATASFPASGGFPYYSYNLNIGWTGGWRAEASLKLSDGRTVTDRWYQSSYYGTGYCATGPL